VRVLTLSSPCARHDMGMGMGMLGMNTSNRSVGEGNGKRVE